jgi:hypothetical protein
MNVCSVVHLCLEKKKEKVTTSTGMHVREIKGKGNSKYWYACEGDVSTSLSEDILFSLYYYA